MADFISPPFCELFHGHVAKIRENLPPLLTGVRRSILEIGAGSGLITTAIADDPAHELEKSIDVAFSRDPECTRANFDIRFVLTKPHEVYARPGLRDKILQIGSGWRETPPFGPNREELLALVSAP